MSEKPQSLVVVLDIEVCARSTPGEYNACLSDRHELFGIGESIESAILHLLFIVWADKEFLGGKDEEFLGRFRDCNSRSASMRDWLSQIVHLLEHNGYSPRIIFLPGVTR